MTARAAAALTLAEDLAVIARLEAAMQAARPRPRGAGMARFLAWLARR